MRSVAKLLLLLESLIPGILRTIVLRARFGSNVSLRARIGFGTIIDVESLSLGAATVIGRGCSIRANALHLAARSSIGHGCKIDCHSIRLGREARVAVGVRIIGDSEDDRSTLVVGAHSWILDECYINVTRRVTLGRNVGVGGRSLVFTHGYWLPATEGYPVAYGDVMFEDHCWIPWDCFLMPGTTVGAGAVVAARSVVTKSVPPRALVGGAPAKVLRESVASRLPWEEQVRVIRDYTAEWLLRCGHPELRLSEVSQHGFAMENGRGAVLVVTKGHRDLPAAAGEFVVVADATDEEVARRPMIRLSDFTMSPRIMVPPVVLAWLEGARSIGLRRFPIDERDDWALGLVDGGNAW